MIRRLAVAVALTALAVVAPAAPAWAHAALTTTDPVEGLVLDADPSAVTLAFTEPVSASAGAIQVIDHHGRRVDTGRVTHPDDDPTRVSTPLDDVGSGTLLVAWRVVSADSHPVSGSFTFSVGATSSVADAPDLGQDTATTWAVSTSRGLGYAGSLVLVGGAAFLLLLWRSGGAQRRVRRLLAVAATTTVGATAASLLLQGPWTAGLGLASVTDPGLLTPVLGSRFGAAHLVRLVLVVGVVVLLHAALRGHGSATVGTVLAGVGLLATYPVTGHAAAGPLPVVAAAVDTVHLAAVAVWVGGLVLLAVAVLRGARTEELRPVLLRWSRVALVAVTVLVATGTWQSWRAVGLSWEALTTTRYGALLMVKVALVAGVVGVGGVAHLAVRRRYATVAYAHVETLSAADEHAATGGSPPGTATELRGLRRGVLLEVVALAAVIAVTAVLVRTPPAAEAYRPVFSERQVVDGSAVQLDVEPARPGPNDLHVYLGDEAGRPGTAEEVTVRLALPERGIDGTAIDLPIKSAGHHERLGVPLPLPGTWTVTVAVRTSEFDSTTRTYLVRVR